MYKTKLLALLTLISIILPVHIASAGTMYTSVNNQSLTEGGASLKFSLQLSAKPSGSNTVSVNWTTNEQCRVAHEGQAFVQDGQAVTGGDTFVFSAKAYNDSAQESPNECVVTYRTASADTNLHNLTTTQTFTIYDDGDAVATTPALYTSIVGPSSITEGSDALFSFGIGPSTTPTDALTISASTTDKQCQLVNGGALTDYVEQTIPADIMGAAIFTVKSLNDSDVEGTHSCTVSHSLKTNDKTYTDMTIVSTSVPIIDDEAEFSSNSMSSEELLKRPELGLLDSKDANNDGIEDEKQPNVVSFINTVAGRRQAIEVIGQKGDCNAVSTPKTELEEDLASQAESLYFPHGLLQFNIICDQPGAVAKVNYYLDELYNTSKINLQKYSQESGYAQIEDIETSEFTTQFGVVSLISYNLTDGGELDEDGTLNGTIVDPVGIAISEVEPARYDLPASSNQQPINKFQEIVLLVGTLSLAAAVSILVFYYRRKNKHKPLPPPQQVR